MSIYIFNELMNQEYLYAEGLEKEEANYGSAEYCSGCGSALSSNQWLPPFEVDVSKKRKIGDFIYGVIGWSFLVSQKFKDMYEKEGFIGITAFHPVELYFRNQLLDVQYYYPDIVMDGAKLDMKKSKLVYEGKQSCPVCQRAGREILDTIGLYFTDESQIKEDIFRGMELRGPYVSERMKNCFDHYGLTNVFVQDASTYIPHWIFHRKRVLEAKVRKAGDVM